MSSSRIEVFAIAGNDTLSLPGKSGGFGAAVELHARKKKHIRADGQKYRIDDPGPMSQRGVHASYPWASLYVRRE